MANRNTCCGQILCPDILRFSQRELLCHAVRHGRLSLARRIRAVSVPARNGTLAQASPEERTQNETDPQERPPNSGSDGSCIRQGCRIHGAAHLAFGEGAGFVPATGIRETGLLRLECLCRTDVDLTMQGQRPLISLVEDAAVGAG